MSRFFLKLVAFVVIYCLAQVALSGYIYKLDRLRDPRQRIFSKVKPTGYRCALLGDSVFCSYYVDDDSQTLWKQIERKTGLQVFPGALNGSRPNDTIKTAIYVSENLEPGSYVFIDVFPGKNWQNDYDNYKGKFSNLMGSYDQGWSDAPLSDVYLKLFISSYRYRLNMDDMDHLANYLRSKVQAWPGYARDEDAFNRIWNRDGDFALKRFKVFDINFSHDFHKLDELAGVLTRKGLRPVFVLTPVNAALLYAYAPAQGSEVLQRMQRYRQALVAHLSGRKAAFLDCGDLVPSEGFADLLHTNALGDELVAGKIAEYIKSRSETVASQAAAAPSPH